MKAKSDTTVDDAEIAKFSAMADSWWDTNGKFKPLHRMNPCRIGYIKEVVERHFGAMDGVALVDIGCGGGLISEPMARLGARVTGIDASEKNIGIASAHAAASGLAIDYRCTTAEALAAGGAQYDVALALEIIEHVADVDAFVAAASALVKPGGLLFLSTLNRTAKSYVLAIAGAEYVMRWLPVGTHDWRKFLKPHELVNPLRGHNVEIEELQGMVYNPLKGTWRLDPRDVSVNYMVVGKKQEPN